MDDAAKCIVFGQLELAEKIVQIEDPKTIKRAAKGRGIPNFILCIWDRHSYGIVHEGNMHKFAQNIELYLLLKCTIGTTLVEASQYDVVWGCGCREHEPAAQQKETWNCLNLLGEILTEVRDELISERTELTDDGVLAGGWSLEPITDFGELQRSCPEARVFIDYLKKGILPTDQKRRLKLEHDVDNFFMKDGKLWHRQESNGRRQNFEVAMIQLVVPVSQRNDVMNSIHWLGHLGFDKCYLAVARAYFWYQMYKNPKRFIRTCPDCQTAKSYHK